jgi:hypothetical protein
MEPGVAPEDAGAERPPGCVAPVAPGSAEAAPAVGNESAVVSVAERAGAEGAEARPWSTEPENGALGDMPGAPAVCGLVPAEDGAALAAEVGGALGALASVVAPLRGAAAAVVLGWVTLDEDAPDEAVAGGEALGAVPTVGAPVSAELAEFEPAASGAEVPEAWVLEPGLFRAGPPGEATLGMPATSPLAGLPGAFVTDWAVEGDEDEVVWADCSSPQAVRARRARADVSVSAARIGSLPRFET